MAQTKKNIADLSKVISVSAETKPGVVEWSLDPQDRDHGVGPLASCGGGGGGDGGDITSDDVRSISWDHAGLRT